MLFYGFGKDAKTVMFFPHNNAGNWYQFVLDTGFFSGQKPWKRLREAVARSCSTLQMRPGVSECHNLETNSEKNTSNLKNTVFNGFIV